MRSRELPFYSQRHLELALSESLFTNPVRRVNRKGILARRIIIRQRNSYLLIT